MRSLYSIKKKIFSYYTTAKSPSTTFLYLWGSFTTTSTFLPLLSSNTAFLLFSIQHHLHHISLSPPPNTHTCTHTLSAHFYCFPSTTSTTFRLFSLHHHLHHNSIVFRPLSSPPPWFLLFFIHNLQHISTVSHPLHSPHFYSFPAPLPPPHSYCFPSTTTTTFQLFSIHHLNHISIVFHAPPPPPHFYCFPLPPPSIQEFKSFPLLHHHPLIFVFSLFLC